MKTDLKCLTCNYEDITLGLPCGVISNNIITAVEHYQQCPNCKKDKLVSLRDYNLIKHTAL